MTDLVTDLTDEDIRTELAAGPAAQGDDDATDADDDATDPADADDDASDGGDVDGTDA